MDKIKKQTKTDLVKIDVFEKDDQFWVTSLDIAEKFEKEHKSVLRAIKNLELPDEFYRRNFAPSNYENEENKTLPIFLISRGGFSFLAMGFTGKKAAEWKIKYIQAFEQMEKTIIEQAKQIRREANREWKQIRENSKIARRTATDIYQEFVNHALEQGTSNGPHWYSLLTERVYDAIIIPGGHMEIRRRKKELKIKNGRETLTPDEFTKLEIMEALLVKKAVHEALKADGFYKDDYRVITGKFLQYGEMVEKRLFLQNNPKEIEN